MNSISSSDLIDATFEENQLCGSKQCPGCGHKFDGKSEWVGLPAGVKFDPTDQELIEHLEAKVEAKDSKLSHPLIDEFIPTIEGDDGICYTHPEKLPGVTRGGLSRHFFHRPSKAYTTGTRKRRRIQTEIDFQGNGGGGGGETRWHKTGKTRPVMANGRQKGCKKILVLYTNFGKNRRPEKTSWVMHQYHLGQNEEEREGELVVSKIFYQTQPRQCNWAERGGAVATGEGNGSEGSSMRRESFFPNSKGVRHEAVGATLLSSFCARDMDILQLKADHFGFDEIGMGEVSGMREAHASGTCEERDFQEQQRPHHVPHDHHQHYQSISTTTAFHMSRPSQPVSTIISPPDPLHHASIILDDHDDSFHVSTIMFPNHENFQQHHKMEGRSASGLEELIMSCTSTDHTKGESSIPNPQEVEWLKYSNFWPDTDNPGHQT